MRSVSFQALPKFPIRFFVVCPLFGSDMQMMLQRHFEW